MVELDYNLLGITIAGGIFVGIVSSLIVQFIIKAIEKKGIVSNMKESIKQEIEENIGSIQDEDLTLKKKGKWDTTNIKVFTTASYESAVNSGNFTLLDKELRKKISELYTFIHLANRHSDLLIKSQFTIPQDKTKFMELIKNQLKLFEDSHSEVVTRGNTLSKKLE